MEWPEKICQGIKLGNRRPPLICFLSLKDYILLCLMSSVLKTIVLSGFFFLTFGCFRWEGKSGCCCFIVARSRSLCFNFEKPVCFLKNPRRSPTHEKNTMGAEGAHVYVKTVAGSEEPMHDTYRPTVEMERRRGLWWLMPRLSLE